jgi:lipid II:glycine glycyltransferase (peptidoglycan interpeptide bridge formation enzyme)
MIYKNDKLISIIPGAVQGDAFKSPTGASFGGFVVEKDIGIEDVDNIVKTFIKYCAANLIKEIYLTPPMQIYYDTWNESVEYSLHYNHFVQISSLYSSVIDFSRIRSKEDLDIKTRYNINKSHKMGVRIQESKDFDSFYPILLKNKEKFDVKPTHTLEELKKIDRLNPDSMILFMAYYKETPIAGQLLFIANKNCILNFYTMHLYEYRNLYSVSYLVEQAIKWCCEKKYKYLDYGVSADTFCIDPMEPSWSLIQFKESMGANGCQRKTYYRRVF